jgi:hypothetical protein
MTVRYAGLIGVAGLVLARIPEEIANHAQSISKELLEIELTRLIRSDEGTTTGDAY